MIEHNGGGENRSRRTTTRSVGEASTFLSSLLPSSAKTGGFGGEGGVGEEELRVEGRDESILSVFLCVFYIFCVSLFEMLLGQRNKILLYASDAVIWHFSAIIGEASTTFLPNSPFLDDKLIILLHCLFCCSSASTGCGGCVSVPSLLPLLPPLPQPLY